MYLILRLTTAAIEKIGLDPEDTTVQGLTILDAYANEHEVSVVLRERVADTNLTEQDLGADDEDSEEDSDEDSEEDSEDDPEGDGE